MELIDVKNAVENALIKYCGRLNFYKKEASMQYLMARELEIRNMPITIEYRTRGNQKIDIVQEVNENEIHGIELKFFCNLQENVRMLRNDQLLNCVLDIAKSKSLVYSDNEISKIFVVFVGHQEAKKITTDLDLFFSNHYNLNQFIDFYNEIFGYVNGDTRGKFIKYIDNMNGEISFTEESNYIFRDFIIKIIEIN